MLCFAEIEEDKIIDNQAAGLIFGFGNFMFFVGILLFSQSLCASALAHVCVHITQTALAFTRALCVLQLRSRERASKFS
jgi:hypothetical protein